MLVKLAYAMQRLKKYLKKIVMIYKDGGGGQFVDVVGEGQNCCEGGHIAHGGSPTREALERVGNDGKMLRKFLASVMAFFTIFFLSSESPTRVFYSQKKDTRNLLNSKICIQRKQAKHSLSFFTRVLLL